MRRGPSTLRGGEASRVSDLNLLQEHRNGLTAVKFDALMMDTIDLTPRGSFRLVRPNHRGVSHRGLTQCREGSKGGLVFEPTECCGAKQSCAIWPIPQC